MISILGDLLVSQEAAPQVPMRCDAAGRATARVGRRRTSRARSAHRERRRLAIGAAREEAAGD